MNKILRILKKIVIGISFMIWGFLCFFIGAFLSCWHYTNTDIPIDECDDTKVLSSGDVDSYDELKTYFLNREVEQESLFYSIVMALKYDYAPAYYDVYHAMTSVYSENPKLGKIDDKTKEEAMYFLRLGAQKGDEHAKQELKRINNNPITVE